jgi:hypothetical protein
MLAWWLMVESGQRQRRSRYTRARSYGGAACTTEHRVDERARDDAEELAIEGSPRWTERGARRSSSRAQTGAPSSVAPTAQARLGSACDSAAKGQLRRP